MKCYIGHPVIIVLVGSYSMRQIKPVQTNISLSTSTMTQRQKKNQQQSVYTASLIINGRILVCQIALCHMPELWTYIFLPEALSTRPLTGSTTMMAGCWMGPSFFCWYMPFISKELQEKNTSLYHNSILLISSICIFTGIVHPKIKKPVTIYIHVVPFFLLRNKKKLKECLCFS